MIELKTITEMQEVVVDDPNLDTSMKISTVKMRKSNELMLTITVDDMSNHIVLNSTQVHVMRDILSAYLDGQYTRGCS